VSLLLSETLRLLTGVTLWLVIAGSVGASTGVIAWFAVRRTIPRTMRHLLALGGAGVVAGSLAHRIGLPDPWHPDPFGRPLLLLWIALGGAIAAVALLLADRYRGRIIGAPDAG
jgi:hypothetical protein